MHSTTVPIIARQDWDKTLSSDDDSDEGGGRGSNEEASLSLKSTGNTSKFKQDVSPPTATWLARIMLRVLSNGISVACGLRTIINRSRWFLLMILL
jgi:hypothetical protein